VCMYCGCVGESRMCALHRTHFVVEAQPNLVSHTVLAITPSFAMTPTTSSTQERVATRYNSNARWQRAGERRREGGEVGRRELCGGIVEIHFEETRARISTHRHNTCPLSVCQVALMQGDR
jgi:hypothetical protein